MRSLLFFIFSFTTVSAFSQHSTSKHHYFNHARKSRTVLHKRQSDIDDSSFVSSEVMVGNTNSWNGDLYNLKQSVQLLTSYDNNKNFEIGAFGVLTYASLNGDNPNGADLFICYRLNKKLSFTVDDYTFIGKQVYLENDFGYSAKIYNMYTARTAYVLNKNTTLNLGYSILNDKEELQQSVFLEYDYNLTSNFTIVLGYASDSKVFDISSDNIYAGIGYSCSSDPKRTNIFNEPINLSMSFNPLYLENQTTVIPFTVLVSVCF